MSVWLRHIEGTEKVEINANVNETN